MSKFKPAASPLARVKPLALRLMEGAFSRPTADISPGAVETRESALRNPPGGARASLPASRSSNSGSGTWPTVDSSDHLALLEVGQVALVAINLIGENKYNARVFYLASDIDATAVSMQKNAQPTIATGWVEGERLLLKDGQKRARSARAGGIPYLKVEICAKPDPRGGYLTSRAMNTERSDQTALDDAIRWKELLADGVFKDQNDLAAALEMSVPNVSKTLTINEIPLRLLHRMKESPITSTLRGAYELSRIFVSELAKKDPEKAEELAGEVIDEIVRRALSVEAIKTLIESRIDGPRRRNRAEVAEIRFGDHRGQLKMAGDQSSLELSFRGLTKDQFDQIRGAITAALDRPAPAA